MSKSTTMLFDILPSELLLEICSYLSLVDSILLIGITDKSKDEQKSIKMKLLYRYLHDNHHGIWELLLTNELDKLESSYQNLGIDTRQIIELRNKIPILESMYNHLAEFDYTEMEQ